MKRLMVFCAVCLFVSSVFAETVSIQEATGIGATRQDAIKQAIFEAVAKAKGINVNSGRYRFDFDSATADIEHKPGGKEIGFDAVSIYAEGTSSNTAIRALVKTYEVLEEKQIDANSYQVKLKVEIYDYKNPDETKRLKLAVMAPKTLQSRYTFGGALFSDTDLQRKITHILNVKLSESNKFSILDRGKIEDVMKEKGLLLLGDSSLAERAKIGNLLGADYLLTGTIIEARIPMTTKHIAAIGRDVYEFEAYFKWDYSLINAATGQIKLSDSVNIYLRNADVRRLTPHTQNNEFDYIDMAEELIKLAAGQVCDRVIGSLYPARIAKILPGGVIVINKGGQDVFESAVYEVIKEGDEIFDHDTKESLGKTEQTIADIKITKVMSNFSYAQLVTSYDNSVLAEGLICRPKEESYSGENYGTSDNIKTLPGGGIKMPFDK